MNSDEQFMHLALSEAAKGGSATWKNPQVGAAIVKNGHLLATGYHHQYGQIHAERDAIEKLTKEQLNGATLYVTLEPCSHFGKQPPCSQLIIDSNITLVVVACVDPHQVVGGKGIAQLRAAGIKVTVGCLRKAAEELNRHYFYFYRHNRPWITAKQALSLDGKVAEAPGRQTVITNQEARRLVHQERQDYHAIVVGATTVLTDDPHLLCATPQLFTPVRAILDKSGCLGEYPNRFIFTDNSAPTWLITTNPALKRLPWPAHVSVKVLTTCSWDEILACFANEELQSLYVEGGPTVLTNLFKEVPVNQLLTYLDPQIIGAQGLTGVQFPAGTRFEHQIITRLGNNLRIDERNDDECFLA